MSVGNVILVENIRRLCKEKGTSIWALERELGIGNGVIAKWAHSNPRIDLVQKVAGFFGCTVDKLLKESKKHPVD